MLNESKYAVNEDGFYDDDPDQVALDYFNFDGYDGEVVQVYEGVSYTPTNQDEIDWMNSEGFKYLVDKVKPYKKYKYDLKNNTVEEVDERG